MRRLIMTSATPAAKVNLTPIIDVALVLVIILLITTPMFSVADMDLELPRADSRGPSDYDRLSISVGRDGELAVDDQEILPRELVGVLEDRLAAQSEKSILVVIRADVNVPFHTIRSVLTQARQAGAQRLAIATQLKGAGGNEHLGTGD